jgi:arabinogalactan endo-1,4-beta-galactosidase
MPRGRWIALAAVAAPLLLAPTASAGQSAETVAIAGFEDNGAATGHPAGWQSHGHASAARTEADGHSGGFRLTHSSAAPFAVETTKRLRHASPGWHTLQAWVRASTGDNDSYIALRGCGRPEQRAHVPPSAQWLRIVVSTYVRSRSCTIVLHTHAKGGEWTHFDDVSLAPRRAQLSVFGADVSSLKKSEDLGGTYRDRHGRRGDALRILKANGMNWIRLRAWVDPADGYHDTAELLRMARRAKATGLQVLVDLHYSDFWADPGKQWTPAAWQGQSFPQLKETFVEYTRGIVRALVAQGTPPAMIQLGNEINPGMLWDYGATWTGCSSADDGLGQTRTECHTEKWPQLAELLTAGYQAVKSASPRTKVMLHLAEGGDNGTFQWWFDNVSTRGVPFDVIGASFYGYWHGTLSQLQFNLDDISARYGKDVVVAETAYPFTLADEEGVEPNIIGDESLLIPGYPRRRAGRRPGCATCRRSCARCPAGTGSAASGGRRRGPPSRATAGARATRTRSTAGRPGDVRLPGPPAAGDPGGMEALERRHFERAIGRRTTTNVASTTHGTIEATFVPFDPPYPRGAYPCAPHPRSPTGRRGAQHHTRAEEANQALRPTRAARAPS